MSDMKEIEVDISAEDYPTCVALGLRMALLQGLFDVTYEEIYEAVEVKYKDRMAHKGG